MPDLRAVLALSEGERLTLITTTGLIVVALLTAVVGPVMLAAFSRRKGEGRPEDKASAALDEIGRLWTQSQHREARCVAAVEWLVSENATLREAAGLPPSAPPPMIGEILHDD